MERYVVFDMIGVVFKSELMTETLYRMITRNVGKKRLKYLYHKLEIGAIDNKAFWKGIKIKNYKKLEKAFLDKTLLDEDLFKITKFLRKKYRLAILSNMPEEWGHYFVRKYKLNKIFDKIILSGNVGVKKPDKKIYEIAISTFGMFCFIDDRLENLKAAGKLGIKTILMERNDPKRKFKPDYTIHSLLELRAIL